MTDDYLTRHLPGLAPDPAPGYWARIDTALEQAAAHRTPVAPRFDRSRHSEASPGRGRRSYERPSGERPDHDGRHRSRILLVAAAILLALVAAGGILAALPDTNPIATSPETTATTEPPSIPAIPTIPPSTSSPTSEAAPVSDGAGSGGSGPAVERTPTGPVVVTGAPLVPAPYGRTVSDATSDQAYGQVAPTIVGTDFDGTPVTIEPDGRRKAVLFVASWAPHAQAQLATLSELLAAQRVPDDVDLYVVSTRYNPDGAPAPQSWPVLDELRRRGAHILRDDDASEALTAYGDGPFPNIAYLDEENRVVARSTGELDADTLAELLTRTS